MFSKQPLTSAIIISFLGSLILPHLSYAVLTKTSTINNGSLVFPVGDLNRDGIEDIVVSTQEKIHIVFGRNTSFPTDFDLSAAGIAEGVATVPIPFPFQDRIGDFNNDGIDDFLMFAPRAGGAIILFGRTTWSDISLMDLVSGVDYMTFILEGIGWCGQVGDINKDGKKDIAFTTMGSVPTTYVIFGGRTNFDVLYLTGMSSTEGIKIIGNADEKIGTHVSYAGDINKDGTDDFLIATQSDKVVAIFGKPGLKTDINVADMTQTDGIKITLLGTGSGNVAGSGLWVTGVKDMNKDGIDDFMVASPKDKEVYLFYGKNGNGLADFNVNSMTESNGVKLNFALSDGDNSVGTVNMAGDVNNDGVPDAIVTTPYRNQFYIIHGSSNLNGKTNIFLDTDTSGTVTKVSGGALFLASFIDLDNDGVKELWGSNHLPVSNKTYQYSQGYSESNGKKLILKIF